MMLVLVYVASSASVALAQDVDRARERFDEGRAQLAAGQHEAAVVAFEESLALAPRTATEVNLAIALAHVGRLRDAVARFETLLAGTELSAEQRSDLERRIGEARAALGRLHVRVEGAAAADVQVDGERVGVATSSAEVAFTLDPGEHVVEARAGEHAWPPRRVAITSGGETLLYLRAADLPVQEHPSPRATPRREASLPPVAPADADDDESASWYWWLIAGAGVAAAAAVVAILLWPSDGPDVVDRAVTLTF